METKKAIISGYNLRVGVGRAGVELNRFEVSRIPGSAEWSSVDSTEVRTQKPQEGQALYFSPLLHSNVGRLSAFLLPVFMLQILCKLRFLSLRGICVMRLLPMALEGGGITCTMALAHPRCLCSWVARWAAHSHFSFVQWHWLSGLWEMGASSSPAAGAGPEEAQRGRAGLHQSPGQSYRKCGPALLPVGFTAVVCSRSWLRVWRLTFFSYKCASALSSRSWDHRVQWQSEL